VRAYFASYLAQDRDTAEQLIADDFVFTSPQVESLHERLHQPGVGRALAFIG
jgi:ketosteroid isomerase-like protein